MAEKATHTPGPWRVGRYFDVIDSDGTFIGVAVRGTEEERKANARFIAAAPDLLEALTDILSNHETAGAGASIFQCTAEQVAAARAAVARATSGCAE